MASLLTGRYHGTIFDRPSEHLGRRLCGGAPGSQWRVDNFGNMLLQSYAYLSMYHVPPST